MRDVSPPPSEATAVGTASTGVLPSASPSSSSQGAAEDEPKVTVLEPENIVDLNAAKAARKSITTYFMYNGHEWEAHEVLGVPAGSPMTTITEVYQKLILTSDPSTFQFYESAHQALLKHRRDRL